MTTSNEVTQLNTVQDLFEVISAWHLTQIATLDHMQQIPEGSAMDIYGENITLSGDIHKGFIAGLQTAVLIMGKLPIQEMPDEAPGT